MMILPLVSIFINPIWSTLSKNINSKTLCKNTLIIEAIAAIASSHWYYYMVNSFNSLYYWCRWATNLYITRFNTVT